MRWIAITFNTEPQPQQPNTESVLDQLVQLAEPFTPTVVVHQEVHRPNRAGVLLEVQSCFRLFGGAHKLIDRLTCKTVAWNKTEGNPNLQLASWSTAQAAWWLAQTMRDFNNLRIMHQRGIATLDELPAHCLDLSTKHHALLNQCGLATLGQLRTLPRDTLRRRLNQQAMAELDEGYGQALNFKPIYQPKTTFEATLELPFHSTSQPAIERTMQHLLTQLESWLRVRQLGTHELHWIVYLHHTSKQWTTRSARCLQTQADWLRLIQHQLATLHFEDEARQIRLNCHTFEAYAPGNHTLFIAPPRNTQEKWKTVQDQLRARLGDDAIQWAHIQLDPRPECSFYFESKPQARPPKPLFKLPTESNSNQSVASSKHNGLNKKNQTNLTCDHAAAAALHNRPLWLLPQPVRLPAPPDDCQWQLIYGPERIEFGWWSNQSCNRDYYTGINSQHGRAWIFKDLSAPNPHIAWYLHGYFA